MDVTTKKCSLCGKMKELTEFHADKSRPLGVACYCKVCRKQISAIYYQTNKEQVLEYQRDYEQTHKEQIGETKRAYNQTHKDQRNEGLRNKWKTDINFKIQGNLRGRMNRVLKGKTKAGRTLDLVGCSLGELKEHLESQFTEGMTWDHILNGKIHIDHIVPCAIFDFTDIEQQRICFHHSNLQPLWAVDNHRKSNKLPHELDDIKQTNNR